MLISTMILAIAASSDSIVLGINIGVKNEKMSIFSILLLSLIPSLGTLTSMCFGGILKDFIPLNIAVILGGVFLIILGLKSLKEILKNEVTELKIPEKVISKDILMLGLALAVNNITLGLGGSIAGYNPIWTSVFSLIFSFLFIYIGMFIALKLNNYNLSEVSEVIGAILVIILGIGSILF